MAGAVLNSLLVTLTFHQLPCPQKGLVLIVQCWSHFHPETSLAVKFLFPSPFRRKKNGLVLWCQLLLVALCPLYWIIHPLRWIINFQFHTANARQTGRNWIETLGMKPQTSPGPLRHKPQGQEIMQESIRGSPWNALDWEWSWHRISVPLKWLDSIILWLAGFSLPWAIAITLVSGSGSCSTHCWLALAQGCFAHLEWAQAGFSGIV